MTQTLRLPSLTAFLMSLLLGTMWIGSANLRADTFHAKDPGTPPVAISGSWQFHLGDDPAWANPALDDSGWEQISPNDTWGAQQHRGYTGYAWYRRHIQVDGQNPNLAILMPVVEDVFELYWNGRKVGSEGTMPPHASSHAFPGSTVHPLGTAPASGVLAVRVWKYAPSSVDPFEVGGFHGAPLLGNAAVLQEHAKLPGYQREQAQIPRLMIAGIMIMAGLIALVLFLRERQQRRFLWLGIYLMADGIFELRSLSAVAASLTVLDAQAVITGSHSIMSPALWMLLLSLFGLQQSRRWVHWVVGLTLFGLLCQWTDLVLIANWDYAGVGMEWGDAISTMLFSVLPLFTLVIIVTGVVRNRWKALAILPLAIAASLYDAHNAFLNLVSQGTRFTHFTIAERLREWALHLGSYSFNSSFLLNTLLFLVLLFTVAQQQYLERRRHTQMELEVKSAREVQHVLIPEEAPPIPGLSITSAYKPATEVGGDFFQVIPFAHGEHAEGAIIVLGDVSGKGLKAAMTVSLIVGAIRTLADFTNEPAEILRGLNQRLMGRVERGFATCLVLRITADGKAKLANAGHMPPYLDGKELPVLGSLPLGIVAQAGFEETAFQLTEHETLTLYTDGIVEARNQAGELFGFDRIASLLAAKPPVQAVVDAACAFGQQDDITILTVQRVATPASDTARVLRMPQVATA